MSQDNVTSLPQAAFRKRLRQLAEAPAVSDGDFADAVYAAQSRFGIDESAFRAGFGLSKGAVDRWTTMKNLPQPAVRAAILLWIAARLEEQS